MGPTALTFIFLVDRPKPNVTQSLLFGAQVTVFESCPECLYHEQESVVEALSDLLKKLDDEGLSLLILKESEILYSSEEGGMAPLVEAIDRLGLKPLSSSTVVDKIVGRAAALLISYFRAKEAHSKIMSVGAEKILEKHGIDNFSERKVNIIRNKNNTGMCPFEALTLEIEDPREAYEKIKKAVDPT